jgi:hypothetical protein
MGSGTSKATGPLIKLDLTATQRAPEKAAEPRTNAKDESIPELQEKLDAAQKRIDELVSGADRLTANAVTLTQRTDAPLPKGGEASRQLEWESDWAMPIATPDEIAAKLFESDPAKAKDIALALRRLIDRKAKSGAGSNTTKRPVSRSVNPRSTPLRGM